MKLKSRFNLRGERNNVVNGSKNKSRHSAVKTIVSEYVQKSSIQGVAYVGDDKLNKFERFWWLIMFVCSVIGGCYLIYQAYMTMKENPIIESPALSRTPMWEVPYPAVTFCPAGYYSSEFNKTDWPDIVKQLLPENSTELSIPIMLQTLLLQGSDQNRYDILRQVLLEIEIKYMDFSGLFHDRKYLQKTITRYGACITFNMYQENDILRDGVILSSHGDANDKTERLWSRDSGFNDNLVRQAYIYPFRSSAPTDGLNIEFSVNDTKRLIYFSSNIFVTFHAPDEVPLFDRHSEVIMIRSGQATSIEINPQLVVSKGIEHYEPEVRQCYYSNERQLKFYRNYTQSQCETECLANQSLVECGCVPYYMPHFRNTELCDIGSTCHALMKVFFFTPKFEGTGHAPIDNCNCLPSCNQVSYVTVRTTSLPTFLTNRTIVSVSNKSPYIQKNVRTELHSISEFFSNCGGSLGLFLGVSVLSVVELLYFCTIRLYLHCKKGSADSNEEVGNEEK